MREIIAKVSKRGQVTVPAEIRKMLDISDGGRIAYVIHEGGKVEVKQPRTPNLRALKGIAGTLKQPMDWKDVLEVAREDAILDEYLPAK
jgi:AbrB family looped-hinge helix DNA binding protein